MGKEDYSFLFDPPKDSDVFTRTLYYPRSPSSPDPSTSTSNSANSIATIQSSLGDNRHAATLSKFTTISDGRGMNKFNDDKQRKVYCYRHQPDLHCQRRTPQEDTVAEIQKVLRIFA